MERDVVAPQRKAKIHIPVTLRNRPFAVFQQANGYLGIFCLSPNGLNYRIFAKKLI
jgi:hypothetical protein